MVAPSRPHNESAPLVRVRRFAPGLSVPARAPAHRLLLAGNGHTPADDPPDRSGSNDHTFHSVPAGCAIALSADRSGYELTLGVDALRALDAAFRLDGETTSIASGRVPSSLTIDADAARSVEAAVREIESEVDLRRPGYSIAVISGLLEILAIVARARMPAHEMPPDVWRMEDVTAYVRANFDEPFSLSEIASRCALSPAAFSREFKRHAGSPLFEYINKIRIAKASSMLKHTTRSITRIAMDVGYNNVSFFNRYFRKVMGMSPSDYRRTARR